MIVYMSKIEELHRLACEQSKDAYIDPVTGYRVLTSEALRKHGKCCGNSCRHCPYGHINVNSSAQDNLQFSKPALMNWVPKEGGLDVLFWSGGKDSFLTLMHLLEEKRNVILLTSFGAYTSRVSIQDIHIKNIAKQAQFFKTPLCLVPLFPNTDYRESVAEALKLIQNQTDLKIERLVFGDLHLEDIRQWRVDAWSEYEIYTPLFNTPYKQLLKRLWALQDDMGLSIKLSTEVVLSGEVLPVGTSYDPRLVGRLGASLLDVMLENGEGHTLVFPKSYMEYSE